MRRYLRFWGPNVSGDVDDELRFHIEMREADLRARGLGDAAAHEAALERFGDYHTVEEWLRAHDARLLRRERRREMFQDLMQDVAYAFRGFRHHRGMTAAIVLVVALGVGANTAMFSVVDAVLLRPLPFPEQDRLVVLDHVYVPYGGDNNFPKSSPDLEDAAAEKDIFSSVAAYATGGMNLSGGAEPARVRTAMATPNLFATLGVRPALGRGFTPDEAEPDAPEVTVLSYGLWQSAFGGDSSVLGKTIQLNLRPSTVIGVMPQGFEFPGTDLWIAMRTTMFASRTDMFQTVIGQETLARLAPGVSIEAADARVRSMTKQYWREGMQPITPEDRFAAPLRDTLVGSRGAALYVLMGAVGFVLLVACANVANLLLARASSRKRELAVRGALGANRWRLARQLFTESVLLALGGAIAGVALAAVSLRLFAKLAPQSSTAVAPVQLDWRVLGFTLVAAVITGVAFGLAPAISAMRSDVQTALKSGGSVGGSSAGARRVRGGLVVMEVALALVLVLGAGLMLRSLYNLLSTDIGVHVEQVAIAKIALPTSRYRQAESRTQFYQAVLDRLSGDPVFISSGAATAVPLSKEGRVGFTFTVEGADMGEGDDRPFATEMAVSPGYFATMGMRIVKGRGILDTDRGDGKPLVVNETLANKYWPGDNPIGKHISLFGPDLYTVVGVVSDVRAFRVEDKPGYQIYWPLAPSPNSYATIAVRAVGDPHDVLGRLRDAVRTVDPQLATFDVQTMQDVVATSIAPKRTIALFVALFGAIALVLAMVGVYAVIAFGVAQRTREIGIRIALGADSGAVRGLVLREGLVLAIIGVVIGTAAALALTRFVGSMLYGVSETDPLVFVGSAAALLGVALLASYLPARRATRVDPVGALREE